MKNQFCLFLLFLPGISLGQAPFSETQPKTALPAQGSFLLQLDLPSFRKQLFPIEGNSFTYLGQVGVGYLAGKQWQVGSRLQLGGQLSRLGEFRSIFPMLGVNLYSRHYLDFKRWYAFGELGVGGQTSWRQDPLPSQARTQVFAEARYGIGLPISPRVSLEVSNAFRLTHHIPMSPGYSGQNNWQVLAPKLSLNIRLGQ